MTATIAQEIQDELTLSQLRAVLFAVQVEANRYKDIPHGDLPIEIQTLLAGKDRLWNLLHGIGVEKLKLLMHEWEIFYTAIALECGRYQAFSVNPPKFMEDLLDARRIVGSKLSEAHAQIRAKVRA